MMYISLFPLMYRKISEKRSDIKTACSHSSCNSSLISHQLKSSQEDSLITTTSILNVILDTRQCSQMGIIWASIQAKILSITISSCYNSILSWCNRHCGPILWAIWDCGPTSIIISWRSRISYLLPTIPERIWTLSWPTEMRNLKLRRCITRSFSISVKPSVASSASSPHPFSFL